MTTDLQSAPFPRLSRAGLSRARLSRARLSRAGLLRSMLTVAGALTLSALVSACDSEKKPPEPKVAHAAAALPR